jgi:hypothetical protein
MRHRHVLAVDRIRRSPLDRGRGEVRDNLVSVEIEVDPLVGAPSLRAAEQAAIEDSRSGEVVDRKSEMEGRQAHDHSNVIASDAKQSRVPLMDCFVAFGSLAMTEFAGSAVEAFVTAK